jgi:hypothetical protein
MAILLYGCGKLWLTSNTPSTPGPGTFLPAPHEKAAAGVEPDAAFFRGQG